MLKSEYLSYINEDNDEFYGDDFDIADLADYIRSIKRTIKGKVKEIYIAS